MNEESLFAAALARPTLSERQAFLEEACAGDIRLLQRLEQLLAADEQSGNILDRREDATTLLGSYQPEPLLVAGQVFAGRFRLREKLGEGGMGEVWVADQLGPVQRRVALKMIRVGLSSERKLARFGQERQALALMDHPSIAKVFDAGVAGGRPFFVMELIDGAPITEYCDEARLSLRERLELFLPVCHAVQHAHQKGVIHRDIKPSNVLVGHSDGRPVPKVIDFGLAKATGPRLTEQDVATEVGALLGTPEYMSPEQADPNGLDVDTRSDVYSLGVVLYELLTGSVPFPREQLQEVPFDGMLRIIREVEPPRPSTRLSGPGALPGVAAARQAEPKRLRAALRGELDWVVMKCLEKDRSRRYESADALAADVRRYLDDEPVLARPPCAGYRLRKHLRRHRGPALAAGLLLLALLGGIVGTTVGLVRADRARNTAEKRSAQIEKGIDLLSSVFEDLDPRAEEKDGRPLRAILGDRLARVADDLDGEAVGDPLLVAGLQDRLGLSLLRLGLAGRAIPLFVKSRAARAASLGDDHPDTLQSMNNLARAYHEDGQMDLALPLLQETLARRRVRLGDDHRETLQSMNNLAGAYRDINKPALALPLHRETYQLRKATFGPTDPQTLTSLNNLAVGYWAAGMPEKALPLHEEALKLRKATLGPHHMDTFQSMSNLGSSYRFARKLDLALSLHEEVVQLCKARLSADHPYTLFGMSNLAATYEAAGQPEKALALRKETLHRRKARLGDGHPDTLQSLSELAAGYVSAGNLDQALPLFRQAAAGVENRAFAHRHAGRIILGLCDCHERLKQHDQAEVWRRKWLAAVKAKDGTEVPAYTAALAGLGTNLLQQHRYQEAEAFLREGLGILQKHQPIGWETFHAQSRLGAALLGQKKHAVAEPLLIQAYQGMTALTGKGLGSKRHGTPTRKPLLEVMERLVQIYDGWGKPEEAAKWRKELGEAKAKTPALKK